MTKFTKLLDFHKSDQLHNQPSECKLRENTDLSELEDSMQQMQLITNATYHVYSNKKSVTYKNGQASTCKPDLDIRPSPRRQMGEDRHTKPALQHSHSSYHLRLSYIHTIAGKGITVISYKLAMG